MLITVLLFLILVLLVFLVVLQLGVLRSGAISKIDQLAREMRRELAGQRSDNLQNFHRLKGELEDLFDDRLREERGLLKQGLEWAGFPAIDDNRSSEKSADRAVMHRDAAFQDVGDSTARRSADLPEDGKAMLCTSQLALFPADSDLSEAGDCETGSPEQGTPQTEPVEYLSVPAADFDPDSDPPFDPDEIDGQESDRC